MIDTGSDLDVDTLHTLVAALAHLSAGDEPRDRIDQLTALERLKCAAAAAQARITATLADQVAAAGDPARSTGTQIGLARHESPHRGRRLTTLATALVSDLPETLAALERGDLNEHRAQIIADGTRDLCAEDRRTVDAALAHRLPFLGDRELTLATARDVMRTDPDGATHRRTKAQTRRRITGRWLGDGTGLITAVVGDSHYSAIMTSLQQAVATDQALGQTHTGGRSHAQLLADHFVARLTGQTTAQRTPVAINMVVSAETLLGDADEPADLVGYGPIPATVARALALASPEHGSRIRRLFRIDDTDHLIAMDSTSRTFHGLLRQFIEIRDQLCRTPWCGGRIRTGDHIEPVATGGKTTAHNGQGLCEDCNLTKETPGWTHQVWSGPLQPHVVAITTPTGHHHLSRAPDTPPAHPDWIETRPGHWQRAA